MISPDYVRSAGCSPCDSRQGPCESVNSALESNPGAAPGMLAPLPAGHDLRQLAATSSSTVPWRS